MSPMLRAVSERKETQKNYWGGSAELRMLRPYLIQCNDYMDFERSTSPQNRQLIRYHQFTTIVNNKLTILWGS